MTFRYLSAGLLPSLLPAMEGTPAREAATRENTPSMFDDICLPLTHPTIDAIYREASPGRRDAARIDVLLDKHRQACGEPEQVAYIAKVIEEERVTLRRQRALRTGTHSAR